MTPIISTNIYLLALIYHESGRPSVAAGNTLAATAGQARPFTEYPQLSEEARRGRELTAKNLLERFNFGSHVDATQEPLIDDLAVAIHECEHEAVDRGWVVVKLNRPWLPFEELPAPAQAGRRGQARYLLERFHVTYTATAPSRRLRTPSAPTSTEAPAHTVSTDLNRRDSYAESAARYFLADAGVTDPSLPLLYVRTALDHALEEERAPSWPASWRVTGAASLPPARRVGVVALTTEQAEQLRHELEASVGGEQVAAELRAAAGPPVRTEPYVGPAYVLSSGRIRDVTALPWGMFGGVRFVVDLDGAPGASGEGASEA